MVKIAVKRLVWFLGLGVIAFLSLSAFAGAEPPALLMAVHDIKPGITCPQAPDNGANRTERKFLGVGPYTPTVYTTGFPTGAVSAINDAFAAWEATDLGNRFNTAASNGGAAPGVALDGINAIFIAPLGGSTIARTSAWYNVVTKEMLNLTSHSIAASPGES